MALFIISAALFIETLDGTILNTAIPAMSIALHVNAVDLKVALISYFLSLAIFIPISGWVSDRFGAKMIFLLAVGLFTLSSLCCGLAHNLTEIVVFRALQGIGGALMLPIGRLIILKLHSHSEIITATSRIAMLGAAGALLGPILGGFITHYFSWRWIFWMNIPFGAITILMGSYFLPAFPRHVTFPLDKIGFALFGLSLAFLTFFLSTIGDQSFSIIDEIFIFVISLGLLLLYKKHSNGKKNAVLDIRLFEIRSFRISLIGNLVSRLGFGGIPFLLPLLFQVGYQFSPQKSGLLLTPWAFGILLANPMKFRILQYFGYRRLLLLNTVFMSLSIWSFILINHQTSNFSIGLLVFLYGFLISIQYGGMNNLAYAEIKTQKLASATSIVSTIQQLGHSFGIALCAILINLFSYALTPFQGYLVHSILHPTLFAMGIIMLSAFMIFQKLHVDDGQKMIAQSSA
jgi:EmrB/QacA subfamily drug resistance transporter